MVRPRNIYCRCSKKQAHKSRERRKQLNVEDRIRLTPAAPATTESMDAPALEAIVESLERIAAQLRGKSLNTALLWPELGALEFVAYWLQDLAERREAK